MRREHCSDDLLLAHLDGEGSRLRRWRTSAHLRQCWECRAKLREIEKDTAALARAARGSQAISREKIDAAKQKFLESARMDGGIDPAATSAQWWKLPACAAGCAAAVLAGYGVWHSAAWSPAPPPPAPLPRAAAVPRLSPPAPSPQPPLRPLTPDSIPVLITSYSQAQLAEAELEAISVLRAYPALGLAAFTFERDSRQGLRISGIAESAAQREMLLSDLQAAIHAAPWSSVLRIPEDEVQPGAPEDYSAPATTVHAARPAAQPLLMEALRDRYEPAEANARANAIATNAIQYSSAAWSSAWTLRRLAQRFPDSTVIELSARGRATLAHLVSAELALLRNALAAERAAIPIESTAAETLQPSQLWSAAERVERLTHSLMSSGDNPPAEPRHRLDELLALLQGLDQLLAGGQLITAYWPSLDSSGEAAFLPRQ